MRVGGRLSECVCVRGGRGGAPLYPLAIRIRGERSMLQPCMQGCCAWMSVHGLVRCGGAFASAACYCLPGDAVEELKPLLSYRSALLLLMNPRPTPGLHIQLQPPSPNPPPNPWNFPKP